MQYESHEINRCVSRSLHGEEVMHLERDSATHMFIVFLGKKVVALRNDLGPVLYEELEIASLLENCFRRMPGAAADLE